VRILSKSIEANEALVDLVADAIKGDLKFILTPSQRKHMVGMFCKMDIQGQASEGEKIEEGFTWFKNLE